MSDTKILLLCNNKIAVPALRELLFYNQVAAIMIPEKNKEVITLVKKMTEGLPVECKVVNRENFADKIKEIAAIHKPVAAVMMTFPYIIPGELLSLFPKGFINFHYGKLPEYRGPEPIFTQIVKQEKNPGLCVHVVTEGVDSGPVILNETVTYDENDTYGMLREKLAIAGAGLINILMKILSFGTILPAVPQDEGKASYHRKPGAADLMINWKTMDSAAIKALVNACNPWNKGCGALIKGEIIGITEVEIIDAEGKGDEPGTVLTTDKVNGFRVCTCDNKALKLNIVYTEQGFFSGSKLENTGLKPGDLLA